MRSPFTALKTLQCTCPALKRTSCCCSRHFHHPDILHGARSDEKLSLLFHFNHFFSLKRQEDFLSSLKAFWLAVFQSCCSGKGTHLPSFPVSLYLSNLSSANSIKTQLQLQNKKTQLPPHTLTLTQTSDRRREKQRELLQRDKNDYLKNSDRLCQKVTE